MVRPPSRRCYTSRVGGEAPTEGLAARLRDAWRRLRADDAPEAAPPGSPFESALAAVRASLDRWQGTAALGHLWLRAARDGIGAVGQPVELSVSLRALARMGAERARFVVDDRVVAEVVIRDEARVHASYVPERAGLLPVEIELLDSDGAVVLPRRSLGVRWLRVSDGEPVVAVDVRAALEARGLEGLAALTARGWSVVWLDPAPEERREAVRAAIAASAAPPGPVLAFPAEEEGFKTLGVDFSGVFLRVFLRQARAAGVGVVASFGAELGTGAGERFERHPLDALAERAADEVWCTAREAEARALIDARSTQDPFHFRLDQMVPAERRGGHRFTVELDNRRARERIFAAIESARSTVHLQLYIVRPSRFTDHLATRLIDRARAGVRVRLLVDALYSGQGVLGRTNPIVDLLANEPGVEVAAFDPLPDTEALEAMRLKRRDHRKLMIVDGQRAWVSGRNASDEYYTSLEEVAVHDGSPSDVVPWLDAHVELTGPLVAEIQRTFVAAFEDASGRVVPRDSASFPPPPPEGVEGIARFVVHHGVGDANAMAAYQAILDGARRHVVIVNDFPVVDTLAAAVRRAIGRGVRVVFLTGNAVARRGDGSFLEGPLHRELFEYLTKRRLEPLLRAGAEAYELWWPPAPNVVCRGGVRPYVHAKVMTADGRVASIGSANLDATASYWEREANVVIEDPPTVAALEAELFAMVARGFRLDPDSEYWARESAQRELTSQLWPESMYS